MYRRPGAPTFPFTVCEVVVMGRPAGSPPSPPPPSAADRAAAMAALATIGITHLAGRRLAEVSGGERQMTLIARALAQEPGLIVMDEPTTSLDFGNQARVIGCIRDLAARGIAVVLSTHDPCHAFADRVALMKRGRIVATGTPEQTLTPEALSDLYGIGVAVAWIEAAGRNACLPLLRYKETSHETQRPQSA